MNTRITRLLLGAAPQADISGNLNDITIPTLSTIRIAPILDAITQGFQNGDSLTAWYEGSCVADATREDIIAANPPPPDVCQCSSQASLSTLHPCSICLVPSLCHLQEIDNGVRKCWKCANKDRHSGEAAAELRTADAEAWFWSWAKLKLGDSLKGEVMTKNLDWKDDHEYLKPLKNGHLTLDKYWNRATQAWTNAYTQQSTNIQHTIDAYSRTRRRQAFNPSIDAIFPVAEFDKSYFTHSPSNLCLTSLSMQFAKGMFVPAVLAHIRDCLVGNISADQVMQRMDDVHRVGIQVAYVKSLRLQKTFNKTELTTWSKEWLAGRLLTSRVSNTSQKWLRQPSGAFKGWKPPCYERFIKIVREMEKKSGKKFPTSKMDDCPFPFHPGSIPTAKLPMIVLKKKLTLTNYFERLELADILVSLLRPRYEDEALL